MQKLLGTVVLVCVILLMPGCGRKSAPTAPSITGTPPGTTTDAPKVSMQAIQISGGPAANSSLAVGDTRQLRASAQLDNGSSEDITSLVEWSSADPAVATVSSTGLVTAVGAGTGRIRASYNGVTGEFTFTIVKRSTGDTPNDNNQGGSGGGGGGGSSDGTGTGTTGTNGGSSATPPTVQSITITGDHNVPVGRNAQFRAIAHMSDGSERDVTGSSNWTSENSMIGSISQSGVFTGILPGANVVRASYRGDSASQPVQVTPF